MNKDMQSKLALLRNRQNKQIETKGAAAHSSGKKMYLSLNENTKLFRPPVDEKTPTVKVLFDIIPFEIATKNHPECGSLLVNNDGDITVCFMPGDFDYKLDIYVHKQIGSENISVLCPKTTFKENKYKTTEEKKCPICEERERLMFEEKRPWDDDLVKALRPKRRILYNVLIDNTEGEQEIQIMDEPFEFLEKAILTEAEIAETEYITFSDLEHGRTIKATASHEVFNKAAYWKYSNIQFIKREPFDESIIHEAIALDSLLNIKTYDELKKIFYETDSGDVIVEPEEIEKEVETKRVFRKTKTIEPEAKEEVKEEKPKRERGVRVIKEEKKEVNPCPAGKEFGYDNNLHDECADCPEKDFDKCADLFDDLKKEGKITE